VKRLLLYFLFIPFLFSSCAKEPGAILNEKKMVFLDKVFEYSGANTAGTLYTFGSNDNELQFILPQAGDFNSFSIVIGKWSYGVSVSGSDLCIKYADDKTYNWSLQGEPGNFGLGYSSWDAEKSLLPIIPGMEDLLPKKEEVQGHDPSQVAALAVAFHNAAYFKTKPYYSEGSIFPRFCIFLFGILLFFLGRYLANNPEDAWNMSEGWKFRNSEPSDMWLVGNSISSYLLLGIGAVAAVLTWIIPL
jgi:hypothetical protein